MSLHASTDAAVADATPGAQPSAADRVPHDLFIAGHWQPAAGGTMTVVNPAGGRKIGPAVAAGCTSILKPAPQTPLSSLALAQLFSEAGLPAGVLNVLPTSRTAEIVPPMLDSGVIGKLSFTGSTAVGKLLLAQAASQVIRMSMELGGNAPFLVLEDADLDIAVEAALLAKMRNVGEACTAANRFLVHAGVAEEFAARLGERMGALKVGDGLEEGVDVGPLIDQAAREKVLSLMGDALDRGATTVTGGKVVDGPGYFVRPTVLTDVAPDSALNGTEIFGLLAAIQTFTDLEEAIARANDTEWGLVGYVITRDLDCALNVSERLEVGMVGLNTGIVSTPSAPFGGIKQSGLGRAGGQLGIEEYLETKYISVPVRREQRGRTAAIRTTATDMRSPDEHPRHLHRRRDRR
jgi:succinate-semialdehyde dehydrogenase/glutarate-semialdehyde dehydrogenase